MRDFNKTKKFILCIALFIFFVVLTIYQNNTVSCTYYSISSNHLPASFHNYKIAQISDLHNANFGSNNSKIVSILNEQKPDIIVITGDLIDSNHTNINRAFDFLKQAMDIAPCYYVTGNHEAWNMEDYQILENRLSKIGVTTLHNEKIHLYQENDFIQLIGLDDPDFMNNSLYIDESVLENRLKDIKLETGFKILLSHRPEEFNSYVNNQIDLVLSGHAHGGQFRIPFIGGIIAPNQGFFPKYDAGCFHKNTTTMIVSRGIGNSIIPIRINNKPEVVIIELSKK